MLIIWYVIKHAKTIKIEDYEFDRKGRNVSQKRISFAVQSRAYQLGLSVGDLAVILLQDFFQLLPLRFFFFLDGWHGSMLAHEQATATKHFMFIHTHLPSNCHTHTRQQHTYAHNHLITQQRSLFSLSHMTTLWHSLQSAWFVLKIQRGVKKHKETLGGKWTRYFFPLPPPCC